MARAESPPPCDICQEPMQITTNADFDGNLSFRYECPRRCGLCAICMLPLRGGSDDGCPDCLAARARGDHQFCPCGSPLVAKGIPSLYIYKAGCAICMKCAQSVALGDRCTSCYPWPAEPWDELLF